MIPNVILFTCASWFTLGTNQIAEFTLYQCINKHKKTSNNHLLSNKFCTTAVRHSSWLIFMLHDLDLVNKTVKIFQKNTNDSKIILLIFLTFNIFISLQFIIDDLQRYILDKKETSVSWLCHNLVFSTVWIQLLTLSDRPPTPHNQFWYGAQPVCHKIVTKLAYSKLNFSYIMRYKFSDKTCSFRLLICSSRTTYCMSYLCYITIN